MTESSSNLVMSTEAWLIHKSPSGNSSLKLCLFTPQLGLVSCLYRGGRTPKKMAMLQSFAPLWLRLNQKGSWHYAEAIEAISEPLSLEGIALVSAMYVNELIAYALKPHDPQPEMYAYYHATLQGLSVVSERLAIEAILRRFEWMLLSCCGLGLDFAEDGLAYLFVPGRGFVASELGYAQAIVSAICQGDFTEVGVLRVAKKVMRQAIDHLLEGREVLSRTLLGLLPSPLRET